MSNGAKMLPWKNTVYFSLQVASADILSKGVVLVVDSLFSVHHCVCGFKVCSVLFCNTNVTFSSFAIISLRKKELVTLLCLIAVV